MTLTTESNAAPPIPPTSAAPSPVRSIAFYLPQFHPIPENDLWWGKGFTEWTNVTRARPRFRGDHQPQLPADLGFYDLRLPETRAAQAELAAAHGINGFCYYHYWFNGKRLLERPFNEVLASGKPAFPFCLCWANESWSRAWNGSEREILMEQSYSPEDDERHIRSLLPAFRDPRYIRVAGRPLFLFYKASRFPNISETARRWREIARAEGVGELFLCRVECDTFETGDPRPLGLDAAVEFQPSWRSLFERLQRRYLYRAARKFRLLPAYRRENAVFDYATYVRSIIELPPSPYPLFGGVCPSFDNSARRAKGAVILAGSTPDLYAQWLGKTVEAAPSISGERLVFINAWNEWAEGNHLEPDQRFGRQYLEATRRIMTQFNPAIAAPA